MLNALNGRAGSWKHYWWEGDFATGISREALSTGSGTTTDRPCLDERWTDLFEA